MTSSWPAILKASVTGMQRAETTGTVWTPAGHWSGIIRDHGSAIGIWDDDTKTMTWVNVEQVTAITQDPTR